MSDKIERVICIVAAMLLLVVEVKIILYEGKAVIPIFATLALCVAMLGAIDKDDYY